MPMFEVSIPRIVMQSVSVVADTEEEALKAANEKYGIPQKLREQIDEFLNHDDFEWRTGRSRL